MMSARLQPCQNWCDGAMMSCTHGDGAGVIGRAADHKVNGCNVPAANIMDFTPIKNITTFGMANRRFDRPGAAATSAALGC